MESKNNGLGTMIRLTVEGMRYQMVEVLATREKEIQNAVREYVKSSAVIADITKEIDSELRRFISTFVQNALQEEVEKQVSKNKEIVRMVADSIKENSTAIAEAIYQRYIK